MMGEGLLEMTVAQVGLGSILYRYRALNDESQINRVCESIRDSHLYWASPVDFNDPFDMHPAYKFEGTKNERRDVAKLSANILNPKLPRAVRRRQAKKSLRIPSDFIVSGMKYSSSLALEAMGVCCLSAKADNILMWSHYGGHHAGICLGYQASLDALDFSCAQKVQYSSARPILNLMHSMIAQNSFDALLTKSDAWAYEEEWRMIEPSISERKRKYPPNALTKVIFGCQTSDSAKARVFDAVEFSRSEPEFYQCSTDAQEFKLHLKRIE